MNPRTCEHCIYQVNSSCVRHPPTLDEYPTINQPSVRTYGTCGEGLFRTGNESNGVEEIVDYTGARKFFWSQEAMSKEK